MKTFFKNLGLFVFGFLENFIFSIFIFRIWPSSWSCSDIFCNWAILLSMALIVPIANYFIIKSENKKLIIAGNLIAGFLFLLLIFAVNRFSDLDYQSRYK